MFSLGPAIKLRHDKPMSGGFFGMSLVPRGVDSTFYACVSRLHSEVLAKDRIPLPQQVAWGLLSGNASRSCCPVHFAVA